jgi:hypothetical protein
VGLVIDVEHAPRADGERPNRQIRIIGDASLSVDRNHIWTKRTWAKYTDPATEVDFDSRALGEETNAHPDRPVCHLRRRERLTNSDAGPTKKAETDRLRQSEH